MKLGQAAQTTAQWAAFIKADRAEMATPDSNHTNGLLAALLHQANFSIGCYCELEDHCHRSVLRALLVDTGAKLA